jgi:antagonist of KipI
MGLIVINPGLSTTVQDPGRLDYREYGVPPGGAFDRGSADLANALVGNPATCAVLELTLTGGIYQAACPLALALAGAPMDARILSQDGSEQSLQMPLSCPLRPSERLVLGHVREGARAYLAVRGGWQTQQRLGSRSSEERVRAGDVLPALPGSIPTRHLGKPAWGPPCVEPLRIIAGPDGHADSGFNEAFWTGRMFRVESNSDRMGLRLGGEPVVVPAPADRLSAPVAPGAVQVAGGQLIVLGVACGTMGGYPHVASVISADLDRIGQLKLGDMIQFRCVALADARDLDRQARQARQRFLTRLSTLAADG